MGTHSQNLVPGSDNTYDLGTTSARWKDLFLRHGVKLYDASSNIWELDHQGITRSGFEGMTTLTPAAAGNPDYVTVQLPRFIGCDFVVTLTGNRAIATADSTDYEIYADWFGPIYACSPTVSAFSAYVTWHVYNPETNKPYVPPAGTGPWNNLRQMCADCGFTLANIPTGLKTVHWIVRWPL